MVGDTCESWAVLDAALLLMQPHGHQIRQANTSCAHFQPSLHSFHAWAPQPLSKLLQLRTQTLQQGCGTGVMGRQVWKRRMRNRRKRAGRCSKGGHERGGREQAGVGEADEKQEVGAGTSVISLLGRISRLAYG
eukprot:scaffold1281_cov13-Tisochrysis_lutea.AAC.1